MLNFLLTAILGASSALWVPSLFASDSLVASGGFVRDVPTGTPLRFQIVTYNVHGPPEKRMDDIAEVLRARAALNDSLVFALQEVNLHHRQTAYRDVASELANVLGTYYAFAIENPCECGKQGKRGLAILSRFPMSQVERVQLPHKGPGGRRRIALGATLQVGTIQMRIYSVHLETRIANRKHMDQLMTVLNHADRYRALPTVILGDFNTIRFRRKKVAAVLTAAGFSSAPYEGMSFQRLFLLRRKLDWIWVRNLEVLDSGVERSVTASDHRPVWASLEPRFFSSPRHLTEQVKRPRTE